MFCLCVLYVPSLSAKGLHGLTNSCDLSSQLEHGWSKTQTAFNKRGLSLVSIGLEGLNVNQSNLFLYKGPVAYMTREIRNSDFH